MYRLLTAVMRLQRYRGTFDGHADIEAVPPPAA